MDNYGLIKRIKDILDNEFKDLVSKVILFGSRVNGTARKQSDYDILVIVKREIDLKTEKSLRSLLYPDLEPFKRNFVNFFVRKFGRRSVLVSFLQACPA